MTDLLELLKQQVSAIVLDGESEHLFEKNNALNQFYPILLSVFKAKPGLIASLADQLNPRLIDIFQSNIGLKEKFLDTVSGAAPAPEIEHTLNKSIMPVMGFLQSEAGSSDPDAIVHLIETHFDGIKRALPQWAAGMLAALGINTAIGETVHQAEVRHVTEPVEEKKSGSWIALIALVILALLAGFWFKSCSERKQAETVTPVQSSSNQPAKFQLSTNAQGELSTCQIYVNNASYMNILQNEVKQIFTHPTGCGAETDAAYHTQFIDQESIPSVLKLFKVVPNASLTWMGDQLSIQTANNADANRLISQVQGLVPNMKVVGQQPVDINSTVDNSISNAQKALASINPDKIRALDVATALNMQIINFASGSSEIPKANQSILDQAAALMQRASQVQLTIKGFTDSVGNAEANKALSLKRAEAIKNYLVAKGVDPAQLKAEGYGQEQPKADNSTPEGQFQNRRIEFEVLNTETGKVREVTNQGVTEVK